MKHACSIKYLCYNLAMTITIEEMEQYRTTLSIERLSSFVQSENDTLDCILERYKNNIRISQALYPELSILEITLRNSINSTLCNEISKTWLEDEVWQQKILADQEYTKLLRAYNDTKAECKSKNFTIGKVIANLNFGFWTGLCSKRYSTKIWHKKECFRGVFVNCPKGAQQINVLSKKLTSIRKLRNRIFHYEPILTKSLLNKYDEILEVLSYLPQGNISILKDTSNFLSVYNKISKDLYKAKT